MTTRRTYDFETLPQRGSISIEEALRAAKQTITNPGRYIMVVGNIFSLMLPLCGLTWWILPIGVFLSSFFAITQARWVTPKWRNWAYAGVADIHQLQRSAELEALLPKHSYLNTYGIMENSQKAVLKSLQERFLEDADFMDDPTIAEVSNVYSGALFPFASEGKPSLIIDCKGIYSSEFEFFAWENIREEAIVIKSFKHSQQGAFGVVGNGNSRRRAFLTFYIDDEYIAIPLHQMKEDTTQIDLLLYIHRGRYEQRQKSLQG